jgi:hypothetical protein
MQSVAIFEKKPTFDPPIVYYACRFIVHQLSHPSLPFLL